MLLFILGFLALMMALVATLKPKSARFAKLVWVLNTAGIFVIIGLLVLFAYLFETADTFYPSPPPIYNILIWICIVGVPLGCVLIFLAAATAVFCKIKKI